MNKRKPIVYVDMNDTICNFLGAVVKARKINPDIKYPWCQLDFFRKLEPIEGAIEGLKKLSEYYDVWILTRPSIKNPLSYMEKRLWIDDHLGYDWCEKLILCPDKTLMIGDLLIDDMSWNFNGIQFRFGNIVHTNWSKVVKDAILLYNEISDDLVILESDDRLRQYTYKYNSEKNLIKKLELTYDLIDSIDSIDEKLIVMNKLLKSFNHSKFNISELKTILVITKDLKNHILIESERNEILLKYNKKKNPFV